MHDGKLALLPTALARLYALAMEFDVNISTVDLDTGEVDAAVGAVVSPGLVMLDRSLDDDDGLHADVLAFALSVVALVADGAWDPEPYTDAVDEVVVIGKDYFHPDLVLDDRPRGELARLMATRCGRAGPWPCFEILPPPNPR